MELTPPGSDPELIKAEFRRRQDEQRAIGWKALPCVALVLMADFLPCPVRKWALALTIAYALYLLWLSLRNWRCPACGKYLGQRVDIARCPGCHTEF
ncbi:MAG TPA: hypothetical protein PLL10_10955 [Elusimicrobiales bacterium]|nr:hypothetical protein [Elusimicrobiales bacterium]